MKGYFEQVYEIVAKIPEGKVTTYGQIALLLGNPKASRAVGWAMKAAPEELRLPCHRVVNRLGKLAPTHVFGCGEIQREILISEGITFNKDGCINMKKHFWAGS